MWLQFSQVQFSQVQVEQSQPAAQFSHWQVWAVGHGGRYPAGVFSGYAAGIGILGAQAILVRALETVPEVRAQIEEREG